MNTRRSFLRSVVAALSALPVIGHLAKAFSPTQEPAIPPSWPNEVPEFIGEDPEFIEWASGFKPNEKWTKEHEKDPIAHIHFEVENGEVKVIEQYVNDKQFPKLDHELAKQWRTRPQPSNLTFYRTFPS